MISILLTLVVLLTDTAFTQVTPCGTTWCNQQNVQIPVYQPNVQIGCPQQNCHNFVKNETLTCEAGFYLENNVCVKKVEISCPAGTIKVGSECVREFTVEPQCPVGTELRNNQCIIVQNRICPVGYVLENNVCLRKEIIGVQCPPGSYLQNNECIRVECPRDYQLVNGQCILTSPCTPTCPPGYILVNGYCQQNSTCTTYPCPPVIPPTQPCVQTTLPPPITTILPPISPPRISCPGGYDLVNGKCIRTEISCPPGYTQHGNNCEKISCPNNTEWSGSSCSKIVVMGGNTTNLVNNTHVTNNFNNVTHDTNVNVHNLNNVYIYKGGEVIRVTNETNEIRQPPTIIQPPISVTQSPCCTVVTPRECMVTTDNKWRCYNRKYQRCGSYCTQQRIQLRPRKPTYVKPILIMPPMSVGVSPCGGQQCSAGHIDCSGCQSGGSCSSSCYEYQCPTGSCDYYDQETFCENVGEDCDLGCC